MRPDLRALEARIGYTFRDKSLITAALTHPSYAAEHGVEHYQRLEFLGDAVLELAVSRRLYDQEPRRDEGQLTRLRAALVREESLCQAAREFGLGQAVYLSSGEEKSDGRDKPSILADVMEAVIAAVYLDGGIEAAFALVDQALGEHIACIGQEPGTLDAKTRLQELVQKSGAATPSYELLGTEGPPHQMVFYARVLLNGREMGRGSGASKRAAQQCAAREALKRIARGANNLNSKGC